MRPARTIVMSVDDVSPCFLAEVRELARALPTGISLVVGLIPNYKGLYPINKDSSILDCFEDFTVEWAMHGYTHDIQHGGRGWDFEFKDLKYEEAKRRIMSGKDLLRSVGVFANNFVPPGFRISRGAMKAVTEEFGITSDLYNLYYIPSGLRVRIPCLSLNWGRNRLEDHVICYSGIMTAYLGKLMYRNLRLLVHAQSLSTIRPITKFVTYFLKHDYRTATHRELLTNLLLRRT